MFNEPNHMRAICKVFLEDGTELRIPVSTSSRKKNRMMGEIEAQVIKWCMLNKVDVQTLTMASLEHKSNSAGYKKKRNLIKADH